MEKIIIIDFGSQYTQLIARRVRELSVYSEIIPCNKFSSIDDNVKGIILSGGPCSVNENDSPSIDLSSLHKSVPILGLCYGAQLIAKNYGGEVIRSKNREYGRAKLNFVSKNSILMQDVQLNSQVWMSHGDTIFKLPIQAEIITSTEDVKIAGFCFDNIYALQFHPEVYHTQYGSKLLENFIYKICSMSQDWTVDSFIDSTINSIKKKIGDDKVILGLSGGVDSTVTAALLSRAIEDKLFCIFINNGLLRKNEFSEVLNSYKSMGLNIYGIDAEEEFLNALNGISDPEIKRKIIGSKFIDVFERESKKIGNVKWLGQGTVYPDVIESISATGGPSATIKSHHNVGGLPEKMNLKVIEPLRKIFKDEVRKIGYSLGVKKEILQRHPFPGPGLAIRIIGEINKTRVNILREVDFIFINGLKKSGLYDDVWQAGAMLLAVKSVGVMGDERTYENVVALRAVTSTDGMTADWAHLPYDFLSKISNEIINKVSGVNRVVYDISSKPPATIEWE